MAVEQVDLSLSSLDYLVCYPLTALSGRRSMVRVVSSS